MLFEDVVGVGHKSVAVDGTKDRRSLFIPVDDWVGAHHAKLGSAATAAKPARPSEEDAVVALATELQRLRAENERLAKEVARLGGSPASSKSGGSGLAWLRDPLRDVLGIGGGAASASAAAPGAEPSPPPLSFREAMKDAFGLQAMKETFSLPTAGDKPHHEPPDGIGVDSAIRDAMGLKKKAVSPPAGSGSSGAAEPEQEPDLGLNFVKDIRDAFSFSFGGGGKKKDKGPATPSAGPARSTPGNSAAPAAAAEVAHATPGLVRAPAAAASLASTPAAAPAAVGTPGPPAPAAS